MKNQRKPKFKVGDTVDLLPFEDFTEHIAIPQWTWNEMNAKNPHIIDIVIQGQHSITSQDAYIKDIYYGLGDGFSYSEEFLTGHVELLPDDLFEV